MNTESQIKENQKEIIIKRQKIDEENSNIKKLENLCVDKNKTILDAQIEIEKKRSQLENIELKYKKESNELKNVKLEQQKKRTNLKIMNSIMKYHNEETKEKIQFYNENIIRPLELKLEKCISLVDYEKNRNNNINIASIIEFVPEFKEKIDNSKSQIVKLDKTLSVQYGTMTKLEEDYKNIQLNILRQTEISSIKTEKFIDIFDAILNYRTKMLKVVEMREKNIILDSKVFQKRYEIKKQREECLRRETALMLQLDKLKQLVRQQANYNKLLSQQYIQLTNK
ncbi:desmoplakin-like [Rhopalosiphum padi]|uniref:desmoplakin-like n=1 Tax=Rhopalosiphum padi TaxID=40932 RepID=UPI00298EAC96|nr:desmoplakin-like [Rhopalosiphum padi]